MCRVYFLFVRRPRFPSSFAQALVYNRRSINALSLGVGGGGASAPDGYPRRGWDAPGGGAGVQDREPPPAFRVLTRLV